MRLKEFVKGDVCIPVEEYMTKDYSKFKRMVGNRQVYDIHVARLLRAFKAKRLDISILVNEKGEVCDGQTRLAVCEIMRIEVRYRVISGLTLEDVQILNSNTRPWKIDDYLDSYCEFGRPDYIVVKAFWERHPRFSLGSILLFLSGQTKAPHEMFRRGGFKVGDKEKAEYLAEQFRSLEKFYPGWYKRDFIQAVIRADTFAEEGFDFDRFRAQLERVPPRLALKDCASAKDYLRLVEEIYNFGGVRDVRLF